MSDELGPQTMPQMPDNPNAHVPDYDVFCTYHGKQFTRLAVVLRKSIKANCPQATPVLKEEPRPRGIRGLPKNASANLLKLTQWWPLAQEAERPFVLMDADTLVVNDLGPVWQHDFDIAYSVRPHRCPIIGGVIFCRPTDATKHFLTQWLAEATRIALRPDAPQIMSEYGGLLQSGLNQLRDLDYLSIHELQAAEWNCCDQVWHEFDKNTTKVIHMKGRLRREVMKGRARPDGPNGDLAPLVEQFCNYMMA